MPLGEALSLCIQVSRVGFTTQIGFWVNALRAPRGLPVGIALNAEMSIAAVQAPRRIVNSTSQILQKGGVEAQVGRVGLPRLLPPFDIRLTQSSDRLCGAN